jgi:hypothetical protein
VPLDEGNIGWIASVEVEATYKMAEGMSTAAVQ